MTATADRMPDAAAIGTLHQAWRSAPGIPGFFTAVNHKQIGLRFIWTAIAFLLIGGIEGLLIRWQLVRADHDFLSPETYNQLFTMHGTTMMFLFAIPALEGLAMYLTPLAIGTRDMPFPRLNAFGYWIYLAGGVLLNWSFLTGSIPDGGWFAYTPLTGPEFSPDRSLDFWLIGVTFVEIAGIVGAIELVVVILKQRAPGMTLGRMPLFVWSVLVMGSMMLVAFPVIVSASILLEVERKFGAPFYDAAAGGDPLLWQHLFWIFGHPEVYIMLIPATGIVSAVIAVHARHRVVAYPLVVAALVAIGIASFGLWVHHMFAVGLPMLVLSLFAVSSYFIAVPSGVQVFAWIATLRAGRPRWNTPMWFVAGFVFIFVLGGITGVMVATAPFDLQAHDTFFVVAHFHYVIIGGVVFPILAGLHHWFPKLTGRLPSEVAGKVSFWLMFVGFNVTFFPQHLLGLQGMTRRVYTYAEGQGWEAGNQVSTVGAFVLAAGVAVFFGNLAWSGRRGQRSGADPWGADSIEWLADSPPASYNFARMPAVESRAPLWDHERLYAEEDLSSTTRGRREVLRTSVLDAHPEAMVSLPGPTPWPAFSAGAIALALVGVLVDWWVLAGVGAGMTAVCIALWLAGNRVELEPAGDGQTSGWWGAVVGLVAVATIIGAFVYSYFYLRLAVDDWPPDGRSPLAIGRSMLGLALLALAVATAVLAAVTRRDGAWLASATSATFAGIFVVLQGVDLHAADLVLDRHAYDAITMALQFAGLVLVGAATLFAVGAAWVDRREGARGGDPEARRISGVFTCGAAALWLVIWAVVYVFPHVT